MYVYVYVHLMYDLYKKPDQQRQHELSLSGRSGGREASGNPANYSWLRDTSLLACFRKGGPLRKRLEDNEHGMLCMHVHITYIHKCIHAYICTYVRTYVRTYIHTLLRIALHCIALHCNTAHCIPYIHTYIESQRDL